MGRPRDGDDRVAWLLDHGHFTAALGVLEADRGLRPTTHQQARPRPRARRRGRPPSSGGTLCAKHGVFAGSVRE